MSCSQTSFKRLQPGGPLWEATGARDGSFDRPRRGYVRALLPDARSYSPELWRRYLLASLDHEAIEEQEDLRAATELARERHEPESRQIREGGMILGGLCAALDEAARTGEAQRARRGVFESPSGGA